MIKYTETARRVMKRAVMSAREMGHAHVGSEHILLGLLSEDGCAASSALGRGGVTYEAARSIVRKNEGSGAPTVLSQDDFTPGAKRVIEEASRESRSDCGVVGTEHLLFAILSDKELFGYKVIEASGACASEIRSALSPLVVRRRAEESERIAGCPYLSKYGRDLVDAARRGLIDPVTGRDEECARVMRILCRRTKNNPCLIGEPGVGKSAIVEGLAQRIASGDVPDELRRCRIVSLDLPSVVAGAKYRGDFEERMKNVTDEARKSRDVILFIDEVHTITGAGAADGAIDGASILKPALSRGEIRLIGATTSEEYRRHIERDAALERRFQSVVVREPSAADSVAILRALRDRYEAHHGIKISDGAIGAAVDLSVRYIAERRLPDKAIDLLDEASAALKMEKTSQKSDARRLEEMLREAEAEKKEAILAEDYEAALRVKRSESALLKKYRRKVSDGERESLVPPVLTEQDVARTLTSRTGIPVTGSSNIVPDDLEEKLRRRVVGQNEAVRAVARAVKRGRAGIKDPDRPAAVLLFTGPTGVGKTECAKALAEALFGTERRLLRFDMSEFSESHSVSKMVGSPPGYVGYEDAPRLTEAVRRAPYSAVLFDEIEKAHRDVTNVLLRIMEEGEVTDALGRECDFRNTVIIMTSNVGGEAICGAACLGFSANAEDDEERRRTDAEHELRRVFSPEFIGRIDEVIPFHPLGDAQLSSIAEKFLEKTARRAAEQGIDVRFDGSVARRLVALTDAKRYGARPLRRLVTTLIDDDLAERITSGAASPGGSFTVSWNGAEFVYESGV